MLSDIVPWKSLAMYAPILTATIAIVAAGVAWRSIRVQRSIARKRAAVDVFIKTEMDQSMIDAYEAFRQGRTSLSNVSDEQMEEFSKSPQYRAIRAYLNIHELIAVGIHNGVFDRRVCYDFWCDVLRDACGDVKRVIDHAKAQPGSQFTYSDLERLNKRWGKRTEMIWTDRQSFFGQHSPLPALLWKESRIKPVMPTRFFSARIWLGPDERIT
jgi:Domain of unknown function (DUF4760)